MQAVYRRVEDIDLFAGGISEVPVGDGIVGPTFGKIIAEQFRRSRYGDRYFYNVKGPGAFTLSKLF